MNKTVDTRICEVTVYNDQALVTRRGVVQLTGEEHELVIASLPVTLLSESVRASGCGTVAVRLLGVRTERSYATEAIAQKVAQLNQEIGQVEEQKRHVQDLLTLLNLQRNFVKSLSTQYLERLTRLQEPEQLNLNQIRELLNFVGEQYSEYSSAIAQREKEQQKLDKQLQALRQQLQQLSTPRPQESFSIIVSLEPSAAGRRSHSFNCQARTRHPATQVTFLVYRRATPRLSGTKGKSFGRISEYAGTNPFFHLALSRYQPYTRIGDGRRVRASQSPNCNSRSLQTRGDRYLWGKQWWQYSQ
jgi:hypothetical protein